MIHGWGGDLLYEGAYSVKVTRNTGIITGCMGADGVQLGYTLVQVPSHDIRSEIPWEHLSLYHCLCGITGTPTRGATSTTCP